MTDARNLTNPNTVIYLIGNKSDLDDQRDVTFDEARQFAEDNDLTFIEASAKTGINVEEAFLETAKKIYQNIQDGSLDLNAAESGVQVIFKFIFIKVYNHDWMKIIFEIFFINIIKLIIT